MGVLVNVVVDGIVWIYLVGVTIAFFYFFGDFVEPIFKALHAPVRKEILVVVFGMGVVTPLTATNTVNALRHLAGISAGSLLLTSAVAVARAPRPWPSVVAVETVPWTDQAKALAISMFAFDIGVNCLSLMQEMESKTSQSVLLFSFLQSTGLFFLYSALSLCVYLPWGENVDPDFTQNYRWNDYWMLVCRAFLAVSMASVASLTLITAMQCFYNVVAWAQGRDTSGGPWAPPFWVRGILCFLVIGSAVGAAVGSLCECGVDGVAPVPLCLGFSSK